MAKQEAESARADMFTTTALWVSRESKYLDTIRELDWENKSFRRQYCPSEEPAPPTFKTWQMLSQPTPKRVRKSSNARKFLPELIKPDANHVQKIKDNKQLVAAMMRKTWRG